MRVNKAEIIETAIALAEAAREISLRYFRDRDLRVDNKNSESFDPVTAADREIEMRIREILEMRAPDDGILGEEFGRKESKSGLDWVIDPIDGTRAFMAGQPTWGTLIALHDGQKPIFGLIDQPYIGERFMGGWGQAIFSRGGVNKPITTRKGGALKGAILYSTFPEIGTPAEQAAFQRVAAQVQLTRYGMDCYAYAMLAAGLIDLVIEAGLHSYDIYAPIALIEAAGGQVTNWQGGPFDAGGQALALADAALAPDVVALLNA